MKDKLLIPEAPLQTLPTLVLKLGLKEALILQQLHYRLLSSPYERDGYTWYKHTYTDWQKQLPFYSERSISRAILNLENDKIIVSTQEYNPYKLIKTKWYRIDYENLYRVLGVEYDPKSQKIINFNPKELFPYYAVDVDGIHDSLNDSANNPQIGSTTNTGETSGTCQTLFTQDDTDGASIKEELKEEYKKDIVVKNHDVAAEIIQYLNKKTNRNYRLNSHSTRRFINGRFNDGYKFEDFISVIDFKVKQWLHDPKMKSFLRPSTLFNPTNFENYLVESQQTPIKRKRREVKPVELDFTLGEED
ncbi:conserved phage C-terminal domain-containing protein [Ureibacillus acetophenoni]|uniref:Uncharacterized phage protein (TIGR02220 family) n=1 Tax=Ureibacillus acetophenoni TaxID=614649 RepID=A0A285UI12_9BACL|nr:conserved phage C-terminal domain-containing protein [Ureibacillus acetophenoni]SOC41442.1 uncharacterized phage protein (TIGR02220 family) [Ureibacillus acetophenoni]